MPPAQPFAAWVMPIASCFHMPASGRRGLSCIYVTPAGLNKSEQRHQLTQAFYTFRQGRVADRSHEAQQYRASGLNLVIASIVWWNATYMADAVDHLRGAGEQVSHELLAHTSPVGWEHIAFSGDFLWDRAAALGRRALNFGRNARRVA